MKELKYCTAIVTNISDPNQQGKIQVRLLPYMVDSTEEHLPWYDPFILGSGSDSEYSFNPPKKDSIILVFPSSETLRHGYYLGGDHIEGLFDYPTIKTIIDSIPELTDSEYPNVKFYLMGDGSMQFHNTENSELGVIHQSGSYIIFTTEGNLIATVGSTKLEIIDGQLNLSGNADQLVGWTNLNAGLQSFVTSLNLHTHTNAITGAPDTPPNSAMEIDIDSAQSSKVNLGL